MTLAALGGMGGVGTLFIVLRDENGILTPKIFFFGLLETSS